jgi:hypothetical protein
MSDEVAQLALSLRFGKIDDISSNNQKGTVTDNAMAKLSTLDPRSTPEA